MIELINLIITLLGLGFIIHRLNEELRLIKELKEIKERRLK